MVSHVDDIDNKARLSHGGAVGLFFAIAAAWILLDRFSKAAVDGHRVGEVIAGPFANIIEFRLSHNTGAAWGMFGDSTAALAVLSIAVCIAIAIYVILNRRIDLMQVVGLALVFGGGLGNFIDRATIGYVIDFINTVFIDFPTFNVADMGVTCGIVLFFIGFAIQEKRISDSASDE